MLKSTWLLITILYCLDYVQLHQENDFDLLIFTQHWPETICKIWTHNNSTRSCAMPNKRDSWTIHGVWPTKLGTIEPSFCNRSWQFDPEQVKPIEDDMEQSWINVEKDTVLYDLWAHEWTKHGTCAAVLEAFNSELKYFSKGINWLKTYSMTDILNASYITPSNDKLYHVADMYNAVKKSLGKNPVIKCRTEDQVQYIFEIRICFSKVLDLVDCDGVVRRSWQSNGMLTNCKLSVGILYPHFSKTNFCPIG